MRISDQRYTRDLRRYTLAARLIHLEARTSTICRLSNLSETRIRSLGRSFPDWHREGGWKRHRGPIPHRAQLFLKSPRWRQEGVLVASLAVLMGVDGQAWIGSKPVMDPRHGELLCDLYEAYAALASQGRISFDHVALLLSSLSIGEEISTVRCSRCHGLMLCDPLNTGRRICRDCKSAAATPSAEPSSVAEPPAEVYQQSLL